MPRTLPLTIALVLFACSIAACLPPRPPAPVKPAAAMTHEERLAEVKHRAAAITLGTRRADVDKLFPTHDGGLIGRSVGRYYEEPEVMIEVPFDTSGKTSPGQFRSPDDKVSGPVRIYRSLMHMD